MPNRFCPKCGKQNVDLIEGFCLECYANTHSIARFPEKIIINQCKACNALFLDGKWSRFNLENIKTFITKHIKTHIHNPIFKMNILEDHVHGQLIGKVGGSEIIQEFSIPFRVLVGQCDKCSKHHSDYWEVKAQLRKKSIYDPSLMDHVEKMLRKGADFVKGSKHGTDFYFISYNDSKEFLREVGKKYHIHPLISNKFVGLKQSGAKKVKYTYCFRV